MVMSSANDMLGDAVDGRERCRFQRGDVLLFSFDTTPATMAVSRLLAAIEGVHVHHAAIVTRVDRGHPVIAHFAGSSVFHQPLAEYLGHLERGNVEVIGIDVCRHVTATQAERDAAAAAAAAIVDDAIARCRMYPDEHLSALASSSVIATLLADEPSKWARRRRILQRVASRSRDVLDPSPGGGAPLLLMCTELVAVAYIRGGAAIEPSGVPPVIIPAGITDAAISSLMEGAEKREQAIAADAWKEKKLLRWAWLVTFVRLRQKWRSVQWSLLRTQPLQHEVRWALQAGATALEQLAEERGVELAVGGSGTDGRWMTLHDLVTSSSLAPGCRLDAADVDLLRSEFGS